MTWKSVALTAVVVSGLVATLALGKLSGPEAVELWAAVLATIVALSSKGALLRRRSQSHSEPPPPDARLWPIAILLSDDAVHVLAAVLS